MAKSIMIQGTGSNVGKSLLVAGLARALTLRGMNVRPFKPQNMSNNAAVTGDGGEIGRAQALQALACKVEAHTDMNPVLLKPESETGAQVILGGKRIATVRARDYAAFKPKLLPPTLEAFERLSAQADIVLVEGAGSPAEINLRTGDIANMGFAEAADLPVLLVGDIDRGGVIAQVVGTHSVLPRDETRRIKGFAINRFRGDPTLFSGGLSEIEKRTGWPSLGVVPWFDDAIKLPAEDAQDIRSKRGGKVRIAVPRLSRIANFDDLDPLAAEPDVEVLVIEPGKALPGDAELVILPGSKSTVGDLAFLRAQGWDIDLSAHIRRGGHVLGICGGYQMLGQTVRDPAGIEGKAGETEGLGLLDVETTMGPKKTLTRVSGTALGAPVSGYEIHIGETTGPSCDNAWADFGGAPLSAASPSGQVMGVYVHGLFASDPFRKEFLERLGAAASGVSYSAGVEQALDNLAAHLEAHFDIDRLLEIASR